MNMLIRIVGLWAITAVAGLIAMALVVGLGVFLDKDLTFLAGGWTGIAMVLTFQKLNKVE